MTNYKRMVSYMYSYHNKVKANNTGYARIETRGDQSKITVHTRLLENYVKTIDLYLYIWEKGQMYCLLLGSAPIKNYCLDFKISVDTYNVLGSDFRLEDMNGILAYMDDYEYIGTEWDDTPIHFSSFHTIRNRSDIKRIESSIKRVQVPTYSGEEQEDSGILEAAELKEAKFDEKEVLEKDSSKIEWNRDEENELAEGVVASTKEINVPLKQEEKEFVTLEQVTEEEKKECDVVGEAKNQVSEIKATEFLTCFKPCDSYEEYEEIENEINRLQRQIVQLEQIKEAYRANHNVDLERAQKQKKELETKLLESMDLVEQKKDERRKEELNENQQTTSLAQRIFNKFPKVLPDVEESLEDCVKIGPQDIGMFPMENWVLANNSFLLHGYYNYHHMILAKKKENNQFKYILGIPGVNNSREAFVARMFGFAQFMPLRKQEGIEDHFGYWCMELKLKE